jgi:hypothetical protein
MFVIMYAVVGLTTCGVELGGACTAGGSSMLVMTFESTRRPSFTKAA